MIHAGGKRAVVTFTANVGGDEIRVVAGEVFPATAPIVKARGELFEDEQPAKATTTRKATTKKRAMKKT